MKTSITIKLTPQESRELRLVVRRQKAPHREVVRAQLILMLASGESFTATSRKVGLTRRNTHKPLIIGSTTLANPKDLSDWMFKPKNSSLKAVFERG